MSKYGFFLLVTYMLTISCCNKIHDYYSGFIVDEEGEPVSSVLVWEDSIFGYSKATTNERGYFRFNMNPRARYLIFSKEGYKTDTVEIVWTQHGEVITYSDFITKDSSRLILYRTNSHLYQGEILRDTIINDTFFIERERTSEFYHSIFIDTNQLSNYYDAISNFKFDHFEEESYVQSLECLLKKNRVLQRNNIRGLPLKWIVLRQYNNKFYTYKPSDFMMHYKVNITDTLFMHYNGEGVFVDQITNLTKINNTIFQFRLFGCSNLTDTYERQITIHIIDNKNGVAIFEERDNKNDHSFTLMIDADKVRNFPIIVNYLESNNLRKTADIYFEEPNYQLLLKHKNTFYN